MSDLSLSYDDIDPGFHDEIERLGRRVIDMLNGSSEWSQDFYDSAVDGATEALTECIVEMAFESLEDSRLDRVLEDRAEQMAYNRMVRGAA